MRFCTDFARTRKVPNHPEVSALKLRLFFESAPPTRGIIMINSRLAASTMTYRASTLEHALTRLKAHGFDKIELCTAEDWIPHVDLLHLTNAQLERIVNMVKRIDVEIIGVNVGGAKGLEPDNNSFDSKNFTIVNNACKLASALGAGFVTIATDSIIEGAELDARMNAAADFNRAAYEIAKHYGVLLSVEAPHKKSISENAELAKKYWSCQDEKIKCTFDDAHLVCAGDDPVVVAESLAERIIHVHLRDAIEGNSLLRYGEGCFDFQRFIDKLNLLGYTGCFSMEYPVESEAESEERIVKSIKFFDNIKFD